MEVDSFVRWIDRLTLESKCRPDREFKSLRRWLDDHKVRGKEEEIWMLFLFTCVHDDEYADRLHDSVGFWSTVKTAWRSNVGRGFKNGNIKTVNHRKMQGKERTIAAIESYLRRMKRGQATFFDSLADSQDPFDDAYWKLRKSIDYFGRLGAWDFLVRLYGTGVISREFEPKRLYLKGSTGPLKGFEHLWKGKITADIEERGVELFEIVRKKTDSLKNLYQLEDLLCMYKTCGFGRNRELDDIGEVC